MRLPWRPFTGALPVQSGNKIHNFLQKDHPASGRCDAGMAEAPDGRIFAIREFDVLAMNYRQIMNIPRRFFHLHDTLQNRYLPLSCSSNLAMVDSTFDLG